MEKLQAENKMGTQPIPKLLASVSIPIIISMIVQALYNVVDSIFVAQYNNDAGTGALTIAFPVQNLLLAVSIGLAIGVNALLSRSLGQKKYDKVNLIAGQGFFLMLCGYLLFLIFGLFFVRPFASIQTDDPLRIQYSVQYISVVCTMSFGVFLQVISERLLQATGKSLYSMITQSTGAVVNIILDPILIFGWFGIPSLGVLGAAIATVIGQCVAGALGLYFNFRYNKEIRLILKNFIPDWETVKETLVIAIPAVLMQAIGSVMTFCMNLILKGFSDLAVNVFGVYFKLQSFVFMPVFGLNSGMVPIIAYNYGAKKKERVYHVLKIAAACAVCYMLIGLAVFQLFPDMLLGMFNATDDMLTIGRVALRTLSISFIFAGISVVSISCCQALGKSIYSLFVSAGRQLVVLIPAAFLLSLLGNVDLVWWAFPIAEIMSLILCVIFVIRAFKFAFGSKKEKIKGEEALQNEQN